MSDAHIQGEWGLSGGVWMLSTRGCRLVLGALGRSPISGRWQVQCGTLTSCPGFFPSIDMPSYVLTSSLIPEKTQLCGVRFVELVSRSLVFLDSVSTALLTLLPVLLTSCKGCLGLKFQSADFSCLDFPPPPKLLHK